jgi:flagellar hook protein FlgE
MALDALFAGVSGLQANQEMLDVIGNNLANSNTTGYKSQSVNFADLVYQNLSLGSGPSATSGGTNPIQIGSGVAVASVSANLQQGTLQATGNTLDLALQGNGYFVAKNGANIEFTRAGSFGVNANNILVDPSTGYAIQRFGAIGEGSATSPAFQTPGNNNINIPIGAGVPGSATSDVTLQGNLSASASGPVAQILTSAQAFTSGGAPATLTTTLDSLTDNIAAYGAGDTITLQGTDVNGNTVNASISVAPTASGPFTMGDLVNAINSNFPGSTASLDAQGNLVVTANNPGPNGLSVNITDGTNPSGGASNWGNHLMNVTTTGADGATVNTSIQIYDPQGTAHTLNLTFQKQADNTWSLTGAINPSEGTMADNLVNSITFNQNGSFGQAAGTGLGNATMSVQFNGFAAPQTISFNFGTPGEFDGMTQNGGTSGAAATAQNGFAAGFLSTLSIGQDGVINGVFTNGQTLAIAQVAVASFANPDALTRVGNNYYTLNSVSGPALIGAGQTGSRGSVQQGQLESSNVDVSLEFTRLIIAQEGYQVNSHVITAADQILQDLGNIIR